MVTTFQRAHLGPRTVHMAGQRDPSCLQKYVTCLRGYGTRVQVTVPKETGFKSLDNRGDYCGSVLPPVPCDSHGHVCDPHSSLGKRGCCLHFHSENVEAQRGPAPLIPVALEVEPGVVWL